MIMVRLQATDYGLRAGDTPTRDPLGP